ncbi:MAG: hypothetical protein LIO86_02950 [Lachnospiraceae bacterium]|nr:hypothetical protein [Lachnospiraceae bacterium]
MEAGHEDNCVVSESTGNEEEKNDNGEEVTFVLVQTMIDALPDVEDISEENMSDVEAQLDAIDEAKKALYQAGGDVDSLDMARYDAACEALATLSESEETGTSLQGSTPSLTAMGTQLTSQGGRLNAGEYYLDDDITLSTNITISANTTVTIDLNGKTLTGNGSGSVITVYGTLNLIDSSTNGNGRVTGGNADYGGGVFASGTFTMEGGTISGNTATNGGSGVYVNSGTFTMSGGEISWV